MISAPGAVAAFAANIAVLRLTDVHIGQIREITFFVISGCGQHHADQSPFAVDQTVNLELM